MTLFLGRNFSPKVSSCAVRSSIAVVPPLFVHRNVRDEPGMIRLVHSRKPPELALRHTLRFHLCIARPFTSTYDHAGTIKRQLRLMLPGLQIHVDGEPLDAGDDARSLAAESAVGLSQCVLLLLSRGCFFTGAIQRAVRASLDTQTPRLLVSEDDLRHGCAQLDSLLGEASTVGLLSAVFGQRHERVDEIIAWHAAQFDHQLESLRQIAIGLLTAMPNASSLAPIPLAPLDGPSPPSRPDVYVAGAILQKQLCLPKLVVLYVSRMNAGAEAVAREMQALGIEGGQILVTTVPPRRIEAATTTHSVYRQTEIDVSWASIPVDRSHGSRASESTASEANSPPEFIGRRARRDHAPSLERQTSGLDVAAVAALPASHMVLYLNDQTFSTADGPRLADEVRGALEARLPIVVLHEKDQSGARGGADLAQLVRSMPQDLACDPILLDRRVTLCAGRHRPISLTLAAIRLGAIDSKRLRKRLRQHGGLGLGARETWAAFCTAFPVSSLHLTETRLPLAPSTATH